MTLEEKRAWIRMIVSVLAYATYVVIVLGRAHGSPLPETPYADALLWTVGAAIAGSIVTEIAMTVVAPRASRARDVRDQEIGRFGEYVGQSFIALGALAAMLMAMAGWHSFWIANVIYLGFLLSMVLGSITRIGLYRGSFPRW